MDPVLIAEKRWTPDLNWRLYAAAPPRELCMTAFGFAFRDGKVALTRHHRGWDVPGGHAEPGEPMEDCARRETFEETGLRAPGFSFLPAFELALGAARERNLIV